jgi:uncharacterized membrane protein YoaK (UPF0700 family)
MGNDGEKKLRQWLKEFGCENACDILIDAGFDSLGMMASLDEEEFQMLEISLKDLPPIKQRRIMKKAEQLADSDLVDVVSEATSLLNEVTARPAARVPIKNNAEDLMKKVPLADNADEGSKDRSMNQIVPNSSGSTVDSDDGKWFSKDEAKWISQGDLSRVNSEQQLLRVNNYIANSQQQAFYDSKEIDRKPPPKKVNPKRIDEVHPLYKIAIIGGMLCLNSGWVNGVAFRSFDGGVTHVTGTASLIGVNFAKQKYMYMLEKAAKVFNFILGATISGGYLGRKRLFKGGPRHAHLLLLFSAMIFVAFVAEKAEYYFLAMQILVIGSGMLCALTSLYTGAVLKTATVTSTAMDIGIEMGMGLFQSDHSGRWKLKIYVVFLSAYVAGGFLGASCYDPTAISGPDFVGAEAQALLVPAAVLGVLAVAWLAALYLGEPDPRGCGLQAEVTWWRPSGAAVIRRNILLNEGNEGPHAASNEVLMRNISKNSLYARGYAEQPGR